MKFNILSIRDYVEDSKEWSAEQFIYNTYTLKEELKEIEIYDEDNPYYGCRREIEALILFLKNVLFYKEYKHEPASATKEEYDLIRSITARYTSDTED